MSVQAHKQLPPEEFYWAALDTAELGSRPTSEQLGYLFESALPCPIEKVQAVFVRSGNHTAIACGMKKDRLREESQGAITLIPEGLPRFLNAHDVNTGDFNLLTGAFEPKSITRLRRRFLAQAIAILLALSGVFTVGLESRKRSHDSQAEMFHAARLSIYDDVLGPNRGPANVPAEVRITAELRQLRQTRTAPPVAERDGQHEDVTASLARLLSQWPVFEENLHLQTEHISITPATMTVRAILPSSGDAQRLAEHLGAIEGWMLQQPQVTSSRENVQAWLRFAPLKEATR